MIRRPPRSTLFPYTTLFRSTPTRLALLRVIRDKRPGSIYELAKLVGRDFKNVQGDLKLLEKYGLVRLNRGRRSEEHTSELQSQSNLVCRLLLEKKKKHRETI